MKKWIKNRESIYVKDFDLQTVIHYVDVGDRAVVELENEQRSGVVKKIAPNGLNIKIYDGRIGTTHFFQWYKIVKLRKLKIKKPFSLMNKFKQLLTLLKKG